MATLASFIKFISYRGLQAKDVQGALMELENEKSPLAHNHDANYSPLAHNHDANYSPLAHNHDANYSPLAHNHNSLYSLLAHTHPNATQSVAGFMAAADKVKLDSLFNSAIEHLGTITLGGTGTFSWTSITGYKHVMGMGMIRSDRGGTNIDGVGLRFNSDAGASYGDLLLRGQGSGVSSTATWGLTNLTIGNCNAATSAPSAAFTPVFFVIPAITGSTLKAAMGLTYLPDQAGGSFTSVFFRSGIWLNSSPITSITMLPIAGGSGFILNSTMSLYGVK
jgi:hypothetical protein